MTMDIEPPRAFTSAAVSGVGDALHKTSRRLLKKRCVGMLARTTQVVYLNLSARTGCCLITNDSLEWLTLALYADTAFILIGNADAFILSYETFLSVLVVRSSAPRTST